MSVLRLVAVLFIFAAVSLGWMVLGGSMVYRTQALNSSLSREVGELWGPRVLVQPGPYLAAQKAAPRASDRTPLAGSTISAKIEHANRYKGLLWYSTFSVQFEAKYLLAAGVGAPAVAGEAAPTSRLDMKQAYFIFPLPPKVTTYNEQPRVKVDGKAWTPSAGEIASGTLSVPVDLSAAHEIDVAYSAGAQEAWIYSPSELQVCADRDEEGISASGGQLAELNDFTLKVTTNFPEIDYPKGTRSPNQPASPADGGKVAHWHFASAMTNQAMGVVMPQRQNAGPIAARMSFFAPVSLVFFFTALFVVVVLKRIPLNPMHYLFLAAAFFAFNILMAYLVDLLNIHAAFWICASVSVLLVVSYLRLVGGMKFAVFYAGLAQMVFLVGFSYAFFWTGYTGLTITVGAILMLFVIMQATGRVKWHEVFSRTKPITLPPALPPLTTAVPVAEDIRAQLDDRG
jgi:hypothetical protein